MAERRFGIEVSGLAEDVTDEEVRAALAVAVLDLGGPEAGVAVGTSGGVVGEPTERRSDGTTWRKAIDELAAVQTALDEVGAPVGQEATDLAWRLRALLADRTDG